MELITQSILPFCRERMRPGERNVFDPERPSQILREGLGQFHAHPHRLAVGGRWSRRGG